MNVEAASAPLQGQWLSSGDGYTAALDVDLADSQYLCCFHVFPHDTELPRLASEFSLPTGLTEYRFTTLFEICWTGSKPPPHGLAGLPCERGNLPFSS